MEEKNEVKEAFAKVKQDILALAHDLGEIRLQIHELKDSALRITELVDKLRTEQMQKEQDILLNQDNIKKNLEIQIEETNKSQEKLKEHQEETQKVQEEQLEEIRRETREAQTTAILDIKELKELIQELSSSINELKSSLGTTNPIQEARQVQEISSKQEEKPIIQSPTNQHIIQTQEQLTPTNQDIPTHIPTDNLPLYALKTHYTDVSIRNQGVPTNKPTNQQTNQHIKIEAENSEKGLQEASEILSSLDSFRKEIRLKFKRLTQQEMLVFSTIYTLEEQGEVDYKRVAEALKLSETSIRDYIHKLILKGIPIEKEKINNKNIVLHVSEGLKKLVSLASIIKLREI